MSLVVAPKRISAWLVLGTSLLLTTSARPAQAWGVGSQLDETGCHESITATALRDVRATTATAPTLTPSRDEAALIADVLFKPPADFVHDLAGMTLLLGVRDNDLKGINPLSSLDLIQVHGSPTTQDEHCIRASADDDAAGNQAALTACTTYIIKTATAALDGLDAQGKVDPTQREPFTLFVGIRGEIKPRLPLFYLRIGAAMHALEDGFPHTYRTADGLKVTVVLNWIDLINGTYDEGRDGPGHRAELDRCRDQDPTIQRDYDLAVLAATELLRAALDPTLSRAQKIEQFGVVTAKYLTFAPGCTLANNWCDAPEAAVTNSITGCSASGALDATTLLSVLAILGAIGWRRRRVHGATIGAVLLVATVFAGQARADDPVAPPAPVDTRPAVPIPAADPAPRNGKEPGRDEKTPTVTEVAAVRADKQLGNPWGFTTSVGGAIDRPALVATVGLRYRLSEKWIVGADADWNPWITTAPMNLRAGVATLAGTVIRRFPMAFDRVNLRTSLHLGISTLLFDVYGAPKYSVGPYLAISPLGIDYDLGHAVRIVWDPMVMALPMPLVGQLPLYYEQFRFMLGIQIGG
ncbi:MAG: hypothetical protein NT062_21725 [Proteobacteria bacterium]|nr:hypothetical protein [Pseudomonadota bacterium]